jgi:hypothetical protein
LRKHYGCAAPDFWFFPFAGKMQPLGRRTLPLSERALPLSRQAITMEEMKSGPFACAEGFWLRGLSFVSVSSPQF